MHIKLWFSRIVTAALLLDASSPPVRLCVMTENKKAAKEEKTHKERVEKPCDLLCISQAASFSSRRAGPGRAGSTWHLMRCPLSLSSNPPPPLFQILGRCICSAGESRLLRSRGNMLHLFLSASPFFPHAPVELGWFDRRCARDPHARQLYVIQVHAPCLLMQSMSRALQSQSIEEDNSHQRSVHLVHAPDCSS